MPRIRRAQKLLRKIKSRAVKVKRSTNAKLRSPRPKGRIKRGY